MINTESDYPYVYNKETLGFRLDSKNQIDIFTGQARPKQRKINSLFTYTWHLVATLRESQNIIHLTERDLDRTVYIDSLNVSGVNFHIKDEDKKKLIASGVKSTEAYLKKYDDENSPLRNKITR